MLGAAFPRGLAPTSFLRAAGTCLSQQSCIGPAGAPVTLQAVLPRGPQRGASRAGMLSLCASSLRSTGVAVRMVCNVESHLPLSQLQIKTDVKYWHALAAFSDQPQPCQQMLPSRFQSQFNLPRSDDPLTSTEFTPMDFIKCALVCQRGECGTLSFKPKSPKTKQKVTSRFLFPVVPCSLSPDIPSIAQLPVCEKYLVEI